MEVFKSIVTRHKGIIGIKFRSDLYINFSKNFNVTFKGHCFVVVGRNYELTDDNNFRILIYDGVKIVLLKIISRIKKFHSWSSCPFSRPPDWYWRKLIASRKWPCGHLNYETQWFIPLKVALFILQCAKKSVSTPCFVHSLLSFDFQDLNFILHSRAPYG